MKRKQDILDELEKKRATFQKVEDEENEVKSDIRRLKYELNSLIGINRFPVEVMNMILEHLKTADLFNCKLVCRRWNEFVKAFRKPELIISNLKEARPRRWKFSKEICAKNSTIIRSDLHFDNLENSFLIGLKKLKLINHTLVFQSRFKNHQIPLLNDLKFINKLVNLETLELMRVDFEDEASLSLPNLRSLAVSHLYSKLKLETPELTNYQGRSLGQVEFVFKEKLTHLCVHQYCSSIKLLKNLQYLCLKSDAFCRETKSTLNLSQPSNDSQSSNDGQSSRDSQLLSDDHFLDNHPHLKELSIRPANNLSRRTYKLAKSSALKVLEQKRRLKKEEFKLVFFGVLLETEEQLEDFQYFQDNLAELHILNYSALCKKELRWVKRVNLSSLLSAGLATKIPFDFFEKFDKVNELVIDYADITDEQIAVLKKFKNLSSLIVSTEHPRYSIDQIVFEKIADALPEIWSLELKDFGICDILNSFDFTLKLKKLRRFLTESYNYNNFLFSIEKFNVFEFSFRECENHLKLIKNGKYSKLELWREDVYAGWGFYMDFDEVSDLYEKIELFNIY